MDAASKSRFPAGLGLALGAIGGLAVGYYWGFADGGIGRASGFTHSEASEAEADISTKLPVVVGRAYKAGSYTTIGVKLSNNTGAALGYAKVTCSLYDKDGAFAASAYTNWTHVPQGGEVSGEIATRVAGISSATCKGSTS